MNRKIIVAAAIYAGLIALCCTALYIVPSLKEKLERTYIAEYGQIDVSDDVSGFIVRDETVYVAKQASRIDRLAESGRLVKAGTRVVDLEPDEKAIEKEEEKRAHEEAKAAEDPGSGKEKTVDAGKYSDLMTELGDSVKTTKKGVCKRAGYVSYNIDGSEAKLSTKALDSLSYDDYKELTDRRLVKTAERKCGSGYPVFKIVKNGKWYLVFYLSKKAGEKYTEGSAVTIDIDGTPADASVSQVQTGSRNSKITLSCKTFFDGFSDVRRLDTTVTVASADGLVLEDNSIIESPDGKIGVFVRDKLGNHIFKPVRKKADDGKKCVVYSDLYVDGDGNYVKTLSTYDEIIATPSDEDIAMLKAEVKAAEQAAAKQAEEEAKAAEKAAAAEAKAAAKAKKAETSSKNKEKTEKDTKSDKESGKPADQADPAE